MVHTTPTSDPDHTVRATRELRGFSFVLTVLMIGSAVLTAIVVPLSIATVTGTRSLTLDGTIEVPYVLDIEGGPQVGVGADGSTTTEWTGDAGDWSFDGIELRPALSTTIHVPDSDRDSQAVAFVAVLVWLSAGWVGLVSLRRVVRASLSGDAFDPRNSGRLRCCGAAALSVPVTTWIAGRLLELTVDPVAPGVHLALPDPGWALGLLVGLGLLALAEVFRSGAVLQEHEDRTV